MPVRKSPLTSISPNPIPSGVQGMFQPNGRFFHLLTTLTFSSSWVSSPSSSSSPPPSSSINTPNCPLPLTTSPNANALHWPSPPLITWIASRFLKRPLSHPPISNPSRWLTPLLSGRTPPPHRFQTPHEHHPAH